MFRPSIIPYWILQSGIVMAFVFSAFSGSTHTPKIVSEETLDLSEYFQDYPYLDSLECKKIKYQSDSVLVEGFVVEPQFQENLPIVIFNRGGNRDFSRIDDAMLINWISAISKHGFIVFASQYRYYEQFGGVEIDDVLNLLQIAKSYPNTDPTKIGMVGWSRGGLMTYLALTQSKEIDCAVIGGAPSDMREVVKLRPPIDNLLEKLIPNYASRKTEELEKRSPLLWTEKLNPTNLLLIHGELDKRVPAAQTVDISKKLDSIGYKHKLWIVPNEGHILKTSKKEKDEVIAEWLKASLQNR